MSDNLRTETLDLASGDLYTDATILNGDVTTEVVYLGTANISASNHGLSAYQIAVMHGFVGTEEEWIESLHATGYVIEQDPEVPGLYNLLDASGRVHGSVPVPVDVVRSVYDAELDSVVFVYMTEHGKDSISLPVSDIRNHKIGAGLELVGDTLQVKVDGSSHASLSVSNKGLKLDGSYFVYMDDLYSDKEYVINNK